MHPPTDTIGWTAQVIANLKFSKPLLKVGCKKVEVLELRKLLAHWNIDVDTVSDVFDNQLESAVKTFQRRVFLKEDGIVDAFTWQALYRGAPVDMPEIKRGCSGEAVKLLQSALKSTGAFPMDVDGKFGSLTEMSVRNFQRRQGLVADGIVGACTWRALSRIPR
ncbi:peptidoglycan-binding protein [Kovacikia minuta CCNUW1]|uniref:peptidoglycan-binding domain-containing protein n=1 Tax=Kovacikia minuta TaxID=2931930 RepID=UPI001CCF2168|nr:peptidoglycan-binding protein [Kovacikia minuta]UBF25894.1 peptidoglycan-binding protein [Kovacikia minuta CCNUW1]